MGNDKEYNLSLASPLLFLKMQMFIQNFTSSAKNEILFVPITYDLLFSVEKFSWMSSLPFARCTECEQPAEKAP